MFFCAFFGFLVYFFCLSGAWAWDFELGACGWELKFQEFLSMPFLPRPGSGLEASCLDLALAWKLRFFFFLPRPGFGLGPGHQV